MARHQTTYDEVVRYLQTMSYIDFQSIVKDYAQKTNTNFNDELNQMIISNFQARLQSLDINAFCPKCGSSRTKKNGKRNHIQLYKCNDCNTKYTLFTSTILEKTRWHWDIWIKVLEMTLNNYSLKDMLNVLEQDYGCEGINIKTLWAWRLKFIHVLASMPMPTLSGVIQIDETFIRESQKGSRHLKSLVSKNEIRIPRYGRKPSKWGVMGPEFATITTAIDSKGYSVCKVAALGKLTIENFVDLFDEYIKNPAYICTDANEVYERYCELHNTPHYVKPSNYLKILENMGYIHPYKGMPQDIKIQNDKIVRKLYEEHVSDRITNRGAVSYETFCKIKNDNNLSLARVNELHSDIKQFIYRNMTNVSTKYLQDYIGYFTYIRNWRVTNGRYPTSKKDAEDIFIQILKSKAKYTIKEINNTTLELQKPTNRYITLLKDRTTIARCATNNKYFKFNEEDGVISFNTKEYLLDQPKYKLHEMARECGIKLYRKKPLWTLITELSKQPNIYDMVYRLLQNDRHYHIDEEDLIAIKDKKYRMT